jgi:hypothetical protein
LRGLASRCDFKEETRYKCQDICTVIDRGL